MSSENQGGSFRIIKILIWLIQLAAEGVLAFMLVKLGMLSTPLLAGALVVLAILLVLTFLLLGIPKKEGKLTGAGIIGIILAIVSIGGSVMASGVTNQVIGTVREVTSPMIPSSVVGVYVLADDPAESITDAKDYRFGISRAYDEAHLDETISAIDEAIGKAPETLEFETVFEMVSALLNGETKAIVLNEAYASLLDDVDEFDGFSNKTKVIFEKSYAAEPVVAETQKEEKPKREISEGAFIIYLSGSDTRNTYLTTSRSDVNILAVVNPQTKEILLVNTPRDAYVPISVGSGAYDKLTHCGVYGINCSRDTLATLYGVDIDYTAQINFTGMETLIDNIGGITVNSDVAFTTFDGVWVDFGENYFNGSQALSFARERKSLAGGDNDRGRNQMKVLTAVIKKMTSANTLLENYSGILGSLGGMFTTDMSYEDISTIVKSQLSDGGSWNINSYAVTGMGGSSQYCYAMPGWNLYVTYLNDEAVARASSLMQKVLEGEHIEL